MIGIIEIIFLCIFAALLGLLIIRINFALNNPKAVKFVRQHKYLHPNSICYFRVAWAWIGLVIYACDYKFVGIMFYISATELDALDGIVARKCELGSKLGETLDPICDKLTYLPPIIYFSYLKIITIFSTCSFLFMEIVGQTIARIILSKKKLPLAANNFGKIKAVLASIFSLYCFLLNSALPIPRFANHIMWICVLLSFNSFAFKLIPNRYYANILSFLNLLCGGVGCWLVWNSQSLHTTMFAILAIIAGQVFDLLDGRMAEKHGSTKHGEWYDDLADFVSFGLCPTIAIIFLNNVSVISILAGAVYLMAISFRLLRFVIIDKKKDLNIFSGLPSPATAVLVFCALLFGRIYELNLYFLTSIILLISCLAISKIKFAHLRRTILKLLPRPIIVTIGAIGFTTIAFVVKYNNYTLLAWFLLSGLFLYLFLGKIIKIK